ncbi:uncharacterized protein [Eurosta solidaginis]|uniref:uncharacterized protein n=1 Tax=Eurosta solidaginis TaxID=178769 RepID=UPI0035315ECC
MSTVEFNHYDTMPYSSDNTVSLHEIAYRQYHPHVDVTPMQQQDHHQMSQQQPLTFHKEQQTELQPIQQTLPITPPPLLVQQTSTLRQQQQLQQKPEMLHGMQTTTTYTIAHNLTTQCPQHTTTASSTTQFATATASTTISSSLDLAVENVMPGIYLTKNFIAWNEENLRSHGFTHVIIIDKHIQELYYPSPVFKFTAENTKVDAFDTYEYISHPACPTTLEFSKEFEAIDLNFGEKSYLTTVLPNCYRAVKFLNKALQGGGTILVIDCNGGEQKCITIIVAYLMYKYNIKFSDAFARLKDYYKKADLDRFYMTQLYEYEPILQVQRAQSRGQSCSREIASAILKRKKSVNDVGGDGSCSNSGTANIPATKSTKDLFNNFNPLSNFCATTSVDLCLKSTTNFRSNHNQNLQLQQQQLESQQLNRASSLQQSGIYSSYRDITQPTVFRSSADGATVCYAWDDSAMD